MPASELTHAQREVDALVVGAGPAGSAAALGLSASGASVMLVDKAKFPRWKVCGCCLNGMALRTLESMNLHDLPRRNGAIPLSRVRLAIGGIRTTLAMQGGVVLSRERFDSALIAEAVQRGVTFQSETVAKWVCESPDGIQVALSTGHEPLQLKAGVVVVADGLSGSFTRTIPGLRQEHAGRARIGAGTVISAQSDAYAPGLIHMAIGAGGYVGIVRIESGDQLNVAAAFDIDFVKRSGGLAGAAIRILSESHSQPIDALTTANWHGTPPLTHRARPPRSARLFLIGDAAGYIEPFTGEGMAWALAGGRDVVPFALAALGGAGFAAQNEWETHHDRLLGRRMRDCSRVARMLRFPFVTKAIVRLLGAFPILARPYLRSLAAGRI